MERVITPFLKNRVFISVVCSLLLAVSLFTVCAENAFATSKNLSITRQTQEKNNWCWAASASMVGRLISSSGPSQSTICNWVKGGIVDAKASNSEMVTALALATNKSSNFSSVYSYASIIATITNNRALVAKIEWTNGSGYHYVVFSGYNDSGSYVRITDPWYNCGNVSYAYSNLITGTAIQSGTGKYVLTFYHSA